MGEVVSGVGDFLGLNANTVNQSAFAPSQGELEFIKKLQEQAIGGGGPTASQAVLQQGLGAANSNAMALEAAHRGISPGLAATLSANAQAQNTQDAAQKSAILKAQEEQSAQHMLGNQFASIRGSAAQGAAAQAAAEDAAAGRRAGLIGGLGGSLIGLAAGGASPAAAVTSSYSGGGGGGYLGVDTSGLGNPQYMSDGGKVPGKQKTPGDNPKNDTVPAMLSPGEIVIPKSKADDPEKAKAFIDQLMQEKKESPDGKDAFKNLVKTQREIMEKIKMIEKSLKKAE